MELMLVFKSLLITVMIVSGTEFILSLTPIHPLVRRIWLRDRLTALISGIAVRLIIAGAVMALLYQ